MKIGILTYQRAHNYGALLQAFALKTFLQGLGHNAEIVDYWPKYHIEDYRLLPYFSDRSFIGKVKALLLLCIGFPKIIKRRKGYIQFMETQLGLSKITKYTSGKELHTAKYDVVVYGSDQIWRKHNYSKFKGFDDVYFGNYLLKVPKKISFAASMGVINLNKEDRLFLKNMMQNFTCISVRESELQDEIKQIIMQKPSLVMDPVFLLEKTKWYELIPKLQIQEKYIFLYQLVQSKESKKLVSMAKDYFGYKVIEIQGMVNPLGLSNRYNKQTVDPFEFLSLIRNAEFVISTSFHGTAFSIIFEKQFYAVGMGKNSGRAQTLLAKLGIENRYIHDISKANFTQSIDYERIGEQLKIIKDDSFNYLTNAISVSKR